MAWATAPHLGLWMLAVCSSRRYYCAASETSLHGVGMLLLHLQEMLQNRRRWIGFKAKNFIVFPTPSASNLNPGSGCSSSLRAARLHAPSGCDPGRHFGHKRQVLP